VSTIIRITRAEKTTVKKTAKTVVKIVKVLVKPGKATTKRTISKRRAAEIKTTGKDNNNSNKIKKSEIIYIREADIAPKIKRNTRLAKKNLRLRFLFFMEK
jgi:hypothetical protein